MRLRRKQSLAPSAFHRKRLFNSALAQGRWCATLLTVVLAGSTGIALAQIWGQVQQQNPNPDKPYLDPAANRAPDANSRMNMRQQQANQQTFEAANSERKKQLSDDSAKLLELAGELKVEVDKTNKDTLSLNVIRRAGEIEKLAHDIREKMRLVVGQN